MSSVCSLADVLWSNEEVMVAARKLVPIQQKCKLTFCEHPAVHLWKAIGQTSVGNVLEVICGEYTNMCRASVGSSLEDTCEKLSGGCPWKRDARISAGTM